MESAIVKLPAGNIISSPLPIDDPMAHANWRGLDELPKLCHANRDLSIAETFDDMGDNGIGDYPDNLTQSRRSRSCAPLGKPSPLESVKSRSCGELNLLLSYHPKQRLPRPNTLPVKDKRFFFPSTSTSQQSKSPEKPIAFDDMDEDFDFKPVRPRGDIAAVDALIPDQVDAKISTISNISRLSSLRPPPLDLRPQSMTDYNKVKDTPLTTESRQIEFVEKPHSQSYAVYEPDSAVSSPYVVRPRTHNTSTPLSPFTPLVLPHESSRQAHFDDLQLVHRRERQKPLRIFDRYFQRNPQTLEIYRQVDDPMLDYRCVYQH